MIQNFVSRTVALLLAAALSGLAHGSGADRIRPYEQDPFYWQYKGEPVLLIGGSDQDNLFNHPDIGAEGLESHLDTLAACGGNYIRNTMSSRDEGNLWPFFQEEATGLYDLDRFNDAYWQRFEDLLRMTHERDIIVQIEVFDRFDYTRGPWLLNPFNPKNNVNYTAEESGLPEVLDAHPGERKNPFFRSVPELENHGRLLAWQEAHVAKVLSISLGYGNVLYCISNETNDAEEWSRHWARFIRDKAAEAGVGVEVTEMWDPWDLSHPMHARTFDHPELYSFVDISQNNHQTGQTHWENAQTQRQRLAAAPRPMNNVKIYGGLSHGGGYEEGLRKLWRNVLGGMASARYHRPGEWTPEGPRFGAGLSEDAQAHLRSVRLLMQEMGWPGIVPGLDFVELQGQAASAARAEKTHVAYTRNAAGEARIFLNGVEVAHGEIGGDLSQWDAGMRLGLANEFNGERPWRGAYHAVAIYNRALVANEVADHQASGVPMHRDGLQVLYAFDEGAGTVIRDHSGLEPALDLHIATPDAVTWHEDGLDVHRAARIASEGPAERLTSAVQASNAFTLEAWLTPAEARQTGPARIVTLSARPESRNFTLGQSGNSYEMRLRTTKTSENALPALGTGADANASVAAARSANGEHAVIFVSHGSVLRVDLTQLKDGLQAEWFDPRTTQRRPATPREDGHFQPPSSEDWILVLK